MPRINVWSIETSSSAARAAPGCSIAAVPSASPKAAQAPNTYLRRIAFIRNRAWTLEFCDSRGGSGRFCGVSRGQGVIQQANNPGNDRHIGQVKNVPIKSPIRRGNVKKNKIGNPTIGQTVDGVPKCPAYDQSQGECGESILGVCKPDQEQGHRNKLEAQQHPLSNRPLGLEQAVADARIAREDNVDERANSDRLIGRKVEDKQQVNFAGLVENAGDCRNGKSKPRLRTG